MQGRDLFESYRFLLIVVGSSYSAVRTAHALQRWYGSQDRLDAMMRRYVHVHLLRIRLRRFLFDILMIVGLLALLAEIVWLHRYQ